MAAITIARPLASVNRVEEGSYPCRTASYPDPVPVKCSPAEIAQAWTDRLNNILSTRDYQQLESLFTKESYWRDQLCLSWDFHTLHGTKKMIEFLENKGNEVKIMSLAVDNSASHRKPSIAALDFNGTVQCVQFWLNIQTTVGKAQGIAKLVPDIDDGNCWKAFTLFTTLRELKGYEELTASRRPQGVEHGGTVGRLNWQDRRSSAGEFTDNEPVVLIIGAGQGGLTSAARLKQLGIEALIIDQNERVGDNWRKRYHQLVLHDPVWYDHLPYLKFPDNWPVFTPKDKLAEWFESYVKILELSVWNSTSISSTKWDDKTQRWTVTLKRVVGGKESIRTIHPKHIIQATGHSGGKNFPSYIEGIPDFKGDRLCHSSEFPGAKENGKGKKAVVVGSCNSGHDIAQDFYEKGYDVTMIQRSSTYMMTSENGLDVLMAGLYEEGGIPTDDADLVFMGLPIPVLKLHHVDATKEISRRDAVLLKGLTDVGFALDKGPDDAGLFLKYFQRGGGYYLDVGASQLIADGKIKIKQGQEISRVNEHSITFTDGSELDADEIVFATGYQNMRGMSRKIFGDEVADRLNDVWGLDEEGEVRTMWRRSGHPGFWFMGGNLALCRYYSRLLALQIKALEVGLMNYDSR